MTEAITSRGIEENNGKENEKMDRPTAQDIEGYGFPIYRGRKIKVAEDEDDDADISDLPTPNLPMVLVNSDGPDGQDGPNDKNGKKEEAQGQSSRKTEQDFFNEFKESYCLGEPLLFHTPDQKPVISLNVGGHFENILLESRRFDMMCHYFSIKMKKTPACSNACINRLRTSLSIIAITEGPEIPLNIRYARHGNAIYIDLANPSWQQVEITAAGWKVIENMESPVKFVRRKGMKEMPLPQRDYGMAVFRELLNVDDDDWHLIAAWLLGAMNPDGPFPILILQGQQGSAKTSTAKLLKDLVDPSDANIQSIPKTERNLIIAASNSWVQNFDNLSGMTGRMADNFCRISTGSGFRTRRLFMDDDEVLFDIKRPVIMNSIEQISARSDLIDRAIIIQMPVITKEKRLPESTLKNYWKDCKASVFGHLCDAVSAALANYDSTKIDRLPRMADFAQWVSAAESSLGWDKGMFMGIYERQREYQTEITMENDTVAQAVIHMMNSANRDKWASTPTDLLLELKTWADERTIRSKELPKAVNVFSNQLQRSAPILREKGFHVERGKSGNRFITIHRIGKDDHPDNDHDHGHDDVEAMYLERGTIE